MKAEQFNSIVSNQLTKCESMLNKKAEEYADDIDRLHNFKKAAHLKEETPKQALAGFMGKHTTSIYDMVADDGDYPIETWDEKITDHINYLLLLAGLVREEKGEISLLMDDLPGLNYSSAIDYKLYTGRHHAND